MDSIQRGQEAEQLLANPLLNEAFKGIREALVAQLEATAIGNIDMQHEITLTLQLIKNVRKYLENWVRDGQLEGERATSHSNWQKFQKRIGAKL